ncbi:hypothetical protein F5H01DRAFT_337076 [Linnemannia elongata]|nr:hypothetical protein F5H01DRAFT_337076 [Linnemannia elongata]
MTTSTNARMGVVLSLLSLSLLLSGCSSHSAIVFLLHWGLCMCTTNTRTPSSKITTDAASCRTGMSITHPSLLVCFLSQLNKKRSTKRALHGRFFCCFFGRWFMHILANSN